MEPGRVAGLRGGRIDEVAAHENHYRLVAARCGKDLLGGFLPTCRKPARGQIQIAENYVVRALPGQLDGFAGTRRAVNVHPLGGEPFIEQHTDALFVVQNQNRPPLQNFARFGDRFRCWPRVRSRRGLFRSDGQIHGEC